MSSKHDGNRHNNPDNINTSGIGEQFSLVVSNYHLVHSLVDGYDTLDTPMVDRNKPLVASMVDRSKPLVAPLVVNKHPRIYSLVDDYYFLVTPLVDGVKHFVTFCVHGNYFLVNSLVDGSNSVVYVSLYGNTAPIAAHHYHRHNSELILACFLPVYSLIHNFPFAKVCIVCKTGIGQDASQIARYRRHNSEVQYEFTAINYHKTFLSLLLRFLNLLL